MQSLKVSDELHELIKKYCILKQIKIEQFVEDTFRTSKALNDFKVQLQKLKFN